MIQNMYGDFSKKRFIVFGIIQYETTGGMADVIGTFDSVEEYNEAITSSRISFDFYGIFDTESFHYFVIETDI